MHPKLNSYPLFLVTIGIIFMSGIQGCTISRSTTLDSSPSTEPVTLSAGDVLQFQFFNNPELNQTQTVRPDGKISLPLIHEVDVRGKTVAGLRGYLEDQYAPHLKYPEITVVVESLYRNRVYVGGEVNTPGFIEMTGQLTVLDAIMQAGGFNQATAKKHSVVLVRHNEHQRQGYILDLHTALKGRANTPTYLKPYDIVYVPQTNITRVNLWIDQYFDQAIPQTVLSTIPFVIYREYFWD